MENENVTLSKKQYEEIMNEIRQIKRGGVQKPTRVKEHVATMRTFKGVPVVNYGRVYQGKNDVNEDRLYMEIKVLEGTGIEKVDYIQFLNSEGDYFDNTVAVKILKQTAHEKIASQGVANKADIKTDKYTNEEIDLIVTSVDYDAEVEITSGELTGKVLTVSTNSLNA